MSSLRLLVDEDLRYEIVLAVRRLEPPIEFETVQERGLGGKRDPEVLALGKGVRNVFPSSAVAR